MIPVADPVAIPFESEENDTHSLPGTFNIQLFDLISHTRVCNAPTDARNVESGEKTISIMRSSVVSKV